MNRRHCLRVVVVGVVGMATTACTDGQAPVPGVIRDIVFGLNTAYSATKEPLALDLYLPAVAPGTKRRLLILLSRPYYHPSFGQRLAEHGIAVAYIDITGAVEPPTAEDVALRRTVSDIHDTKAAVRFFRKDAATVNRYGIDPDKMFLGGHSAKGALSGITTYLDDVGQAEPAFRDLLTAAGGLEGASGNPGYDSSVAGWISLAGCLRLADLDWITASSPPMLVVYGTKDTGIPTSTGTITLLAERTVWAGATALYDRAMAVGLTASQIYAIPGGNHDSALDSESTELLSRITGFITSLP